MQFLRNFKRKVPTFSPTSFFCLILALAVSLILLPSLPALARQAEINLTILHVNDTHGHIIPSPDKSVDSGRPVGGAEYLAKMVERERAANPRGTILLSAGDMFQGTPVSNLFHGKPVIEIMNYLHYDAMALGNHEFDWGQDVLQSIISSASFPVVSANVFERGHRRIRGVRPYVMLKRKGLRIAVIGMTTPDTYYTSKAGNLTGLTFVPPEKVLPAIIRRVRAQGASIIIALTHDGLDSDRELARKVKGIDIIVGGHSHTVIMDPVIESGTVIVQAGSNGVYLGVLNITFDRGKKKILSYTRKDELRLVSPASGAQLDPNVAGIVDKYEAQVQTEFSKVIGTAAADLTRDSTGESDLGDVVTDAMREASDAQIAFQNGGGIRADIPKGPITLEAVFTALPFEDDLVSMDLTGEQIMELLEKSVLSENMLQVSGMQIVYDLSKPAGEKAVSVKVAGKPVEPRTTYKVVTNDFLASGGNQFNIFKKGRNISVGPPQRDAVADYIRKNSPINVRVRNRIIFRD
ncbi:MAG: bifunctional UDP-sugar hydrolase/5'-nucleotidase [Syntrophobacteraceae bacterium]